LLSCDFSLIVQCENTRVSPMKVNKGTPSDAMPKHKPFDTIGRIFFKPEAILILLLALFGLSVAWRTSSINSEVDFYQFWVVGQSMNHPGINNVYSDDARESLGTEFLEKAKDSANLGRVAAAEYRKKLETYSSPFLYALFGMFSTGNYEIDIRNYRLLMLAALIFGIGNLCRLLNHSWMTTLGAIAIFTDWFEPVSSDMRVGNVNSLQLAALVAYLRIVTQMPWNYRDILGGAFLGLLMAFKPNLVFVAGVLGVNWMFNGQIRRLWFHAFGFAIGVIAAILFAAASFRSPHCWTDWISALHSMPGQIITVDRGNFSAAQFLDGLFGQNTAILLAVIFSGLTIALFWSREQNAPCEKEAVTAAEEFPEVFAVSIGCLLIVLTTRLAWLHYYVLTIPAFLFLLRTVGVPSFGIRFILRQILSASALVALAPAPLACLGIPLSIHTQGVLAVYAALFLFFALAIFPRRVKIIGHRRG